MTNQVSEVDKIVAQLETQAHQDRLAAALSGGKQFKRLTFSERLALRGQAINLVKKGSK